MAANSTLIAIQCGAGVPAPRCHLRRNLVTKTQKTTIMAANPALQYGADALALVSTPSQLHRNLVAKRDKTIVAAFPINLQYQTDIPEYTACTLENLTDVVLKLDSANIWEGSSGDFPDEIPVSGTRQFEHNVDPRCPGSVAGLAYGFGEGWKWVIAWSNRKNEVNKVYTKILPEGQVVGWDEIKQYLDRSGQDSIDEIFPFAAKAEIDATSATPTMKAKIRSLNPNTQA